MFLTRTQVRDFDRRAIEELGIPSLVLMENAGRGAAEVLIAQGIHGPVGICCGKGNNGGDGLVMARQLVNRDFQVKVFLFADPADLTAQAATHWNIVQRLGIPAEIISGKALDEAALTREFANCEWLVDALYGTGLTGEVRPPLDRVIGLINASPARVFAVDIPSGLDADTGQPLGATIRAEHTATFAAPKIGFASPGAVAWVGKFHVVDIGVKPENRN